MLSYNGGNGNDVVFTVTNVPGSAVSSSVTSGNGDHTISPNECNSIDLVISNKTGTTMTGITATLSSPTIGVAINQAYSGYADVPASSAGTNRTSFQISTLTNFSCGTSIELDLAVNTRKPRQFHRYRFSCQTGQTALTSYRIDMTTPLSKIFLMLDRSTPRTPSAASLARSEKSLSCCGLLIRWIRI